MKKLALLLPLLALAASGCGHSSSVQETKAEMETPSGIPASLRDLLGRAETGDAEAQLQIGVKFLVGKPDTSDLLQAEKWLRKSAGQDNALAMFYLGTLLMNPEFEKRNPAEGLDWVMKASVLGDAATQSTANNLIGVICATKGDNQTAAREWFRKSAEQGDASAMCNMARSFEIEGNDDEALFWWNKAAEKGSEEAKTRLATPAVSAMQNSAEGEKHAEAAEPVLPKGDLGEAEPPPVETHSAPAEP